MEIPWYTSIEKLKKQYATGEQPILVRCSDLNEYVCKYLRSSATPYKLVCEVIGSVLASEWGLSTPDVAFINLLPEHWSLCRSIKRSAPAFGSKMLSGVIDVNANWKENIRVTHNMQGQIVSIALFDLWLANEDRNWHNSNLLYDVIADNLVVIDHGCILNTATFDYNLTLLTDSESILTSDLAHSILNGLEREEYERLESELRRHFYSFIEARDELIAKVLDNIPDEWRVPQDVIRSKLLQLFGNEWIDKVWETFVEYFYERRNG